MRQIGIIFIVDDLAKTELFASAITENSVSMAGHGARDAQTQTITRNMSLTRDKVQELSRLDSRTLHPINVLGLLVFSK